MSKNVYFDGFYEETVTFYEQLKENNDKDWFEEHRQEYDRFVLEPARSFINVMGERLRSIVPNIIAIPSVNKSLFKIHRDIRFSPDKTAFKTHLAVWFWEGNAKRMECSGFYFHLQPEYVLLGAGIYVFPKAHLAEYRRSVDDDSLGEELVKIIGELGLSVKGTGQCSISIGAGDRYKKVPRGYDPNHPRADLLLNKGLTAFWQGPLPQELYSPKIIDFVFEKFERMLPLHRWLYDMVERAMKA